MTAPSGLCCSSVDRLPASGSYGRLPYPTDHFLHFGAAFQEFRDFGPVLQLLEQTAFHGQASCPNRYAFGIVAFHGRELAGSRFVGKTLPSASRRVHLRLASAHKYLVARKSDRITVYRSAVAAAACRRSSSRRDHSRSFEFLRLCRRQYDGRSKMPPTCNSSAPYSATSKMISVFKQGVDLSLYCPSIAVK